jgi:very-short-patch-repair endonuclease
MMQGFIDEEETKISNSVVYSYPKLVWNDLQLRDKTNRIQTLMQLNDKGLVSAQTLLEELDLDYDSEVEKIRDEQVMASPDGQMGGPGAANLGTMGMGAGLGGPPGAGMPPDIAGEGMGMPGAGGMGAPGADMGGMGGAPAGGMGGGMGAAAGAGAGGLPIIGKRGSKSMQQQQEEEAPMPQMIRLTKLEQRMYKMLLSMQVPYGLYGQYSVSVPGEQRPFSLDFAYPKLGVGIEVDGAIWHQREDFKQRDMNRDQKLANVGWRVLRFREDAVEDQTDAVRDIIYKNLVEAEKSLKKSAESEQIVKYASGEGTNRNPSYDFMIRKEDNIGCYRKDIADGIQILYMGTVDNGE